MIRTIKKNYFDSEGRLIIKPYRLKDLAAIYDVCTRTMRRWINKLTPEIGPKKVKYFTIEQVTAIVNAVGVPQKLELKKAA